MSTGAGARQPVCQIEPGHRQPSASDAVVAWLLLFMGLATFAPCILLPEWRTWQAMETARQQQQRRVDTLQAIVDREHRLAQAIQTDPAVAARLARRELRFRRPGERTCAVSVDALPVPGALPGEAGLDPSLPDSADTAGAVALSHPSADRAPTRGRRRRAFSRIIDDYGTVFCDRPARTILMAMSVGLVGVGFWLGSSPKNGAAAPRLPACDLSACGHAQADGGRSGSRYAARGR